MVTAGVPILRDINELERIQMSGKNTSDYATRTQKRCGKILQEALLSARPRWSYNDNIGGRGRGLVENYFLVSPLTNFNNFQRALPLFATSIIALTNHKTPDSEHEWLIEVGAVYHPLLDDFFVADGREAFHNQKWLRLGKTSTNHTTHSNHAKNNEQNFGAAVLELCYLAGNRIDKFRGEKLPLFEIAAGLFIALSAGVKITYGNGENLTPSTLALLCKNIINQPDATISFEAK